ncbi:MAG: hypothetical protein OES09_00150 [Gammaproteobacteria bacterium]|nr:hypothetical protein [Gammaproteobacteria bacterium]
MAIQLVYPPSDTHAGGVRVDGVDWMVLWTQLTGNIQQKINKAIDFLQDAVDQLQVRDDLPTDDPDRTTDPALPNYYFWERLQGTWYVVTRVALITGIVHDQTESGDLLYWNTTIQGPDVLPALGGGGDADKPILSIEQKRTY